MDDDRRKVSLDNHLTESLDLSVMSSTVVHLSEAIAYLMSQKIAVLLDTKGLDQSINSFDFFEGTKAE